MPSNADIVAAARGWLGTRFHHQGRLKKTATHKGGVDCLGLLVGIARELDLRYTDGTLLAELDRTDYTYFPDTNYLQQQLERVLCYVPLEGMAPGHVALVRIEQFPQHMAIISDLAGGFGFIHSYAPARAVVEHTLDEYWRNRIARVYRFF
jgi:hypothetical protein